MYFSQAPFPDGIDNFPVDGTYLCLKGLKKTQLCIYIHNTYIYSYTSRFFFSERLAQVGYGSGSKVKPILYPMNPTENLLKGGLTSPRVPFIS